ncbi:MAG: DUF721 domain-containing protein [Rickettsiales bacterium]
MKKKNVINFEVPNQYKLKDLIFAVNKPLIGKKGTHFQKLLKDWSQITGTNTSQISVPIKISSIKRQDNQENILYIATNNASVAMELGYRSGIIKEQINFYFGYNYINQIKFIQSVFQVNRDNIIDHKEVSAETIETAYSLTNIYHEDDELKLVLIEIAKELILKR